jgi:hypothetical protein
MVIVIALVSSGAAIVPYARPARQRRELVRDGRAPRSWRHG